MMVFLVILLALSGGTNGSIGSGPPVAKDGISGVPTAAVAPSAAAAPSGPVDDGMSGPPSH
jgi:hypothetical protein